MGIIMSIIRMILGSKRGIYEAQAMWKGTRRLTKNIQRDANQARRFDGDRIKILGDVDAKTKQAISHPEKRLDLVKDIAKEVPRLLNDIKGEIESNARILVNTESILYQMKEQMINTIIQEIKRVREAGFPQDRAQQLIVHLQKLQALYEKDLDSIRLMFRSESRGRFQLATLAMRSAYRIEREVRKDAKLLRRLNRDFESTLANLPQVEFQGDIDQTQQRIDRLVSDLEKELQLLMEIAQDDVTVMHKIKEPLIEIEKIIRNLPDPNQQKVLLQQIESVHDFEEKTLNNLRLQTRRLERREAA